MDRTRFPLLTTPGVEEEILAGFCAPVRMWWRGKFDGKMTGPQRLAVPAIAGGRHTLVCAPTGSGKTLCAFISILSDLLGRHLEGKLREGVDTVYVSPLRALGRDVARNLVGPLGEIVGNAEYGMRNVEGGAGDPVRVGMRTGDTTAKERARMVRRPPHILVTTPESLALCLAQRWMREHLRGVRRIVIDEIHSLAGNKRGVDLALSVERLAHLVVSSGGKDPQRIGLSATIAPLERVADYLVGADVAGRTCAIADASFGRALELEIASVFGKTPFSTSAAINKRVYETLEKIIRTHRTTLVFTNTRAATERVTFALRKRFAAAVETRGEEHPDAIIAPGHIEAHHSSLDRDVRVEIERRLKAGELRCVVCSTSLELGIDVGTIDRVVLLNSPKGVARGLQRVGRSGHRLDAVARGTFVPTVPADLIESMVTMEAMRKRAVGEIAVPRNCLDVLAQHLIGMAVQGGTEGAGVGEAYEIVRRTIAYAGLEWGEFEKVVRFVTDVAGVGIAGIGEAAGGCNAASIPEACVRHRDCALRMAPGEASSGSIADSPTLRFAVSSILYPLRKSIAGLYAQNVGTITQEGQVKVKIKEGAVIGAVEEAFAQVLKAGDRFVLGGKCVQFVGAKGMTVEVVESAGQTPTVPRWYSGTMAMETGLAGRMREFRAKVRAIAPAGEGAIARMLMRQYRVSEEVARVAAGYLHAQFRYADIPVEGQLLVERVPDEEATVLVFHTMIGRAANEALARGVAYRMHKRFGGNATVVVDDYAFGVWVAQTSAAKRADRTLIRSLLAAERFEEDLAAAVEASELFRSQFRFTAIRAHALLQNKFGRKRFIGQMQGIATRLYEALKEPEPDHLLIAETRRTVMEDLLAMPAAKGFLEKLAGEGLRLVDLPTPSPFAFGLFATGRRDTLQLADTADFLLAMYEQVQRRLGREEPKGETAGLFS